MLYRGRRYINTVFVSVFRQLFNNHAQFPWSSDFLQSKIFIDESYPRGERKFPCIICNDVTDGQFFESSFDQNFQQDVYEDDGITIKGSIYGITLKPTIQVSVSAMTKYDCEIIADYICGFMQHYGLNKFADAGITILEATGTTPSPEEYGKNNIYTIQLNYSLMCEWQKFVSINDDLINRIVVPDISILYNDDQDNEQLQHEGESVIIEE